MPWTAVDVALTFALAIGTFLLVPFFVGGGLPGVVAAEVLGLALVPVVATWSRGLPLATLGLAWPRPRALLGALLVGAGVWYVSARLTAPWARLVGDEGEAAENLGRLLETTPIVALALLTAVPAVCEEIVARGLLCLGLRRRIGAPLAIAIATVAFAALHVSVVRAVPTAVLGTLLGVLTVRAGSVVPAMLAHAINNGVALLLATGRLDPLGEAIGAAPDLALVAAATLVILGIWTAWPARDPSS